MTSRRTIPMLALLASVACDPSGTPATCAVGADCASGLCMPDGRCAPQQDAGPAERDGGRSDAGGGDAGTRDGGSDVCRPSGDTTVTRAEAPFGPGLAARYVAASDVAVDTAGRDLGDGRRRWDLSAPLPGDHDLDLTTEPLDGRWYADLFPGAQYTTRLSPESDLLGVFRAGASALELLGVVSPEEGVTRTELTYSPPVRVLVFPLEPGLRWTSESRVTGLAQGLAANYGEAYDSEVDARGEVVTPYAPFEALRVRTTLTREVALLRTVVRQLSFVAECFGSVATIVSEDDETEAEFDRAAEIRRLGF